MRFHNSKIAVLCLLALPCITAFGQSASSAERGGNLAPRTNDLRKQYVLSSDDYWRLSSSKKERFDASGLLLHNGKLLTVNDRGPQLYEIIPGADHVAALRPTKLFTPAALSRVSPNRDLRYDCEGIALDPKGNIFICEESKRSVFRFLAGTEQIEQLSIDWTPVSRFFKGSINASFEGIAIGAGKLYLANERDAARIVVVDLSSLRVEDSFAVDSTGFAFGGPHYSDLAFFGGRLYVLDRNHRSVMEVDPATKKVVAEYSFGQMELQDEFAYMTDYPTGTMEGLAVEEKYFWLVTDNNGRGRFKARDDFRPTLFRCKRP